MSYLILGLARTGESVYRWLKEKGEKAVTFDENSKHANFNDVNKIDWGNIKTIVQSPGISLAHPASIKAQQLNIPIVTDINILNSYNRDAFYIGITGTNGKSTTTALVGHILRSSGFRTEIGGNFGKPVLDLKGLKKGEFYVLELSSYQLEIAPPMSIDIASCINISKDHLERHKTMENYVHAKSKIFHSCKHIILGIDDSYSKLIYNQFKNISHIETVSHKNNNAYVNVFNNNLYEFNELIANLNERTNLMGDHNLQNIGIAYSICKKVGIKSNLIIDAIKTFKGLEHRFELIKTINNISFINDSKATNSNSTIKALKTLISTKSSIHLILGGKAKKDGIKPLHYLLSQVKKIYLIGESCEEFSKELSQYNYEICYTLEIATKKAFKNAQKINEKTSILLSPACASFDQFRDFEDRGNSFKRIVNSF